MKRVPSWFFQGAQASRLCCLVVTGGTPVPLGQALNRSPIGGAALSLNLTQQPLAIRAIRGIRG